MAAVRVGREIQGRAGKGVTTITGLPLPPADAERDGVIEIQGDHRDVIVAELVKLGWPAKKAGG